MKSMAAALLAYFRSTDRVPGGRPEGNTHEIHHFATEMPATTSPGSDRPRHFGTLTAGLAYWMSHDLNLSGIVFLAMSGNVVLATLGGSMIPVLLKRLNVDPALASTVWLTTLTDWIGFLLLLGLASIYLKSAN